MARAHRRGFARSLMKQSNDLRGAVWTRAASAGGCAEEAKSKHTKGAEERCAEEAKSKHTKGAEERCLLGQKHNVRIVGLITFIKLQYDT